MSRHLPVANHKPYPRNDYYYHTPTQHRRCAQPTTQPHRQHAQKNRSPTGSAWRTTVAERSNATRNALLGPWSRIRVLRTRRTARRRPDRRHHACQCNGDDNQSNPKLNSKLERTIRLTGTKTHQNTARSALTSLRLRTDSSYQSGKPHTRCLGCEDLAGTFQEGTPPTHTQTNRSRPR